MTTKKTDPDAEPADVTTRKDAERVNTEAGKDADGATRVRVRESVKPHGDGNGVILERREGDKTYRVTAANEREAREALEGNPDFALVKDKE